MHCTVYSVQYHCIIYEIDLLYSWPYQYVVTPILLLWQTLQNLSSSAHLPRTQNSITIQFHNKTPPHSRIILPHHSINLSPHIYVQTMILSMTTGPAINLWLYTRTPLKTAYTFVCTISINAGASDSIVFASELLHLVFAPFFVILYSCISVDTCVFYTKYFYIEAIYLTGNS